MMSEIRHSLPSKGILFVGGHPNLTKKLHQKYPAWNYASDQQLKKASRINQTIVFYWTGYGSHKLMQYVYSKLPKTAKICYVSATNITKLEEEMMNAFVSIYEQAC